MPQESTTPSLPTEPGWQGANQDPLQGLSSTNPALRRCCAAWDRAYKRHMAQFGTASTAEFYAKQFAARAFCKTMPTLAGLQGIDDFIICTTHGLLIGAISEKLGSQLMCATRAALARLASANKLSPPS